MTGRAAGSAGRLPDPLGGSQRRRSPRLSAPTANSDDKMVAVKRSITVKKIAPRKTGAPSEHNKENTPRRSGGVAGGKQRVSTPGPKRRPPSPPRSRSSISGEEQQQQQPQPPPRSSAMPSPILPSPPPVTDPQQLLWSRKVRRSYSRLSDPEPHSPGTGRGDALFGFDKLQTPEVRRAGAVRSGLEASLFPLTSFTSMLESEAGGGGGPAAAFPEPDPNIPGVALVKEKRRRKKVQQVDTSELEVLAAQMNAEFEEAEEFQLVVE